MGAGVQVGDDGRAFNTVSSGESQAEFLKVAGHLERLLTERENQVKAAMDMYEATGVSEEYRAKEARWNDRAQQTRQIVTTLKASLGQNDETALTALKQAGNSVSGIAV